MHASGVSSQVSVLSIGEAMVDVIFSARPGAASPGHGRIRLQAGGTPVNAALATHSVGASAAVIAKVGDDAAAEVIRAALAAIGASAWLSVEAGGRTGIFVSVGDRVVADRGVNDLLSASDVASLPDHRTLLVSGYTMRAATAAAAVAALGSSPARWRAVDAGGAPELPAADDAANVLFGTAAELRIDPTAPEEGARRLAERYELVVVKLGAEGAVVACDGTTYGRRPTTSAPRGAVGAGDALDGAFLAGLALGLDPEAALDVAVDAASAAIAGSLR